MPPMYSGFDCKDPSFDTLCSMLVVTPLAYLLSMTSAQCLTPTLSVSS